MLLLLSAFLLISVNITAQNEVLRERDSLHGISEFGVVVNIEKPDRLEELSLSVDSVRSLLINELAELEIEILEDETLRRSDQFPILYLHINVMYAMPGIYPFAAEMKFYQPAKLPLNNDIRTTASTWHDSFIGVVSPDLTDRIADSSVNMVQNFKADFLRVN